MQEGRAGRRLPDEKSAAAETSFKNRQRVGKRVKKEERRREGPSPLTRPSIGQPSGPHKRIPPNVTFGLLLPGERSTSLLRRAFVWQGMHEVRHLREEGGRPGAHSDAILAAFQANHIAVVGVDKAFRGQDETHFQQPTQRPGRAIRTSASRTSNTFMGQLLQQSAHSMQRDLSI